MRADRILQIFACVAGVLLISPSRADAQWVTTNGISGGAPLYDLTVSGNKLIAAIYGGIQTSTDNGASWSWDNSLCSGRALAVYGSRIVVGTQCGVYEYQGVWVKYNWPTYIYRAVAFSDDGTVTWSGTENFGVLRNGVDFYSAYLSNKIVLALAVSGTNVFAGTYGGGVFRSSNGGSWTAVNTGLTNLSILSLKVSGANLFAGTNGGGVFLSTNNGASWTAVNNGLPSTASVRSFALYGTSIFAATDQVNAGIFLSTNNGTSWTAVNTGLPYYNIQALAINNTYLFAGALGGAVYRRRLAEMIVPIAPTARAAINITSTSFKVSWSPVPLAAEYQFDLSADNFATFVSGYNNRAVNDTILNLTNLTPNTSYSYRVRAKNTAGASPNSNTIAVTTLMTPPIAPTVTAATNVSSASFTANWSAVNGAASYRLDVTDALQQFLSGYNDLLVSGTSQAVTGLTPNNNYWYQVRAVNNGGTSPNSNQMSVTTAPPAPTLTSPVDVATGVSISPTLSWNASPQALSYRLQVSTASNFISPAVDVSGITSTSYIVSNLPNNTTYYWRVNAYRGSASLFSSTWSFTTILAAPTLLSPSNGAIGIQTNPTLSWNASSGATSYRLQVSTDSAFASTLVVNQSNITGTTYGVINLANNTTYYWRVNATNSGGTSSYSNTWSFTTVAGPVSTPTVTTTSATLVTSTSSTLNGTVNPNGLTTAVTFQYGTTTNYGSTVTATPNSVSGTSSVPVSAAITALSPNSTYHYRVVATNSAGTTNGADQTFATLVAAPAVPALVSPADRATGISVSPTISWSVSTGATSYRLQVSTDPGFITTAFNDSTIVITSQQVGPLANNTTYYWRVNASNSTGTSAYSSTWNFTTIAAVPTVATSSASSVMSAAATLNGTVNANGSATTAYFEWGTSNTLVTSTATTPTSIGSGTNAVPATAPLTGLNASTTYYYRVVGQNSAGTSRGTVLSFTTFATAPTAPILSSPLNNATGVSTSPTLSWNASGGATSYRLQVATNPSFTSSDVDQSGITGTSYTLSYLSNSTTYYWRVNATNTGGTSSYSSTWSFTTGAGGGVKREAEPNNTAAQANQIAIGDSVDASIYPAGDVDYFKFSASAGDTAEIFVYNINNSTLSGFLELYSSSGTRLDFNDNFFSSGWRRIVYIAQTSGTFFIRFSALGTGGSFPNESPRDQGEGFLQRPVYSLRKASLDPTGDYRIRLRKFVAGAPFIRNGIFRVGWWFLWNGTTDSLWIGGSVLNLYPNRGEVGGLANTNGLSTEISVDYGTTSNYGSKSTWGNLKEVNTYQYVIGISNLSANTTYHYRVVASNSKGTSTTADTTFRTPANAQGWTTQTTGRRDILFGVSFVDALTGTAVGESGTILRTTNGGATWTSQISSATDLLLAVTFANTNTGSVVGSRGTILRTTNDGATWTSQMSGTTNDLWGVSFVDANKGIVVGWGSLLRTSNGGLTWTQASGINELLTGVSMVNGNIATATGFGGVILRTTDGGITWNYQGSGTKAWLTGVSFIDANTGTVVGKEGTILRTTNGGATWIKQSSGTSNWLYRVSFVDASNGTIIGDNGTILRTTNGGATWTSQASGTSNWIFGISSAGGATTVVGDFGMILRSAGPTFVDQTGSEIPTTYLLRQNYPNPFNPATTIEFSLPKQSMVVLTIYNVLGTQIDVLLNEHLPAGQYRTRWSPRDLPSGVYFYQLRADNFSDTKKILLLR